MQNTIKYKLCMQHALWILYSGMGGKDATTKNMNRYKNIDFSSKLAGFLIKTIATGKRNRDGE